MAKANSTRKTSSAPSANDSPRNEYSDLSPVRRAELALEMATEIAERQGQYIALSSVIVECLAPPTPNEDSPEWSAYRLAQLLEDSMSDMAQLYRLIKCATATRDMFAQEGGAA